MPEETGQEKTEQATQRRREETRNRGQVARSTEVNSAALLLVGFSALLVFRRHILTGLEELIASMFRLSATFNVTPLSVQNLIYSMMVRFFSILMPVFLVIAVAGVVVNLFQIGFLFTGEPLRPKLNKINPGEGFKRIFSRRSLETLARDILKIVVVIWIGYSALKKVFPQVLKMVDYPVEGIFAFTGSTVFSIAMKILIGYGVIAVLDYAFQRWDYERSMMMTRQEVREELKQTEGDPLLRARIRTMQREIARRRMMEEVPNAQVVITNPTEIAVALAYDAGMVAPVVVAKGRRIIAEKIRQKALEAGVPIVENIALAQALYKAVDIGGPIPPELFTAVAEVLAYVYRLKGKTV